MRSRSRSSIRKKRVNWVTEYERTFTEKCRPVGFSVNPQVACVSPMMLHHDEDEAIRRGTEGANFFGYSLGHFYVFGEHQPGRTDVWSRVRRAPRRAGLRPRGDRRGDPRRAAPDTLGAKQAAGDTTGLRGSVGTPAQVREYLRRFEEAGVDQVIFVLQAGRNRHEHIMESIEIFGREVLPEFVDRDEAQVRAKQERLAPAIEAAMQRRAEDYNPVDVGDYSFPALPVQWAKATGSAELEATLQQWADDRAAGKRDLGAGITG